MLSKIKTVRPILPFTALSLAFGLGACAETDLQGPFFPSQPVVSSAAQGTYEYDAHAAGFVNSITYSLVSAPPGMTVDQDGLVTWTPTLADLGDYSIELKVTDGETTVMQAWDLAIHQDLLLGVTYSPLGHTGSSSDDDVIDFLTGNDPWGRLIGFHSSWRDSIADAGSFPALADFAMASRSEYGIEPAVGLGWSAGDGTADLLSDGDMLDNSWTNQETRDEFLALVTDYADTFSPRYLFLGNEINAWFFTDQAGWPDWLSMLGECYDAIKEVSPDTIVFTTFQLERLKGLGAATAGWTDPPHWNLVDDVVATGKVDAIGFTSYPYFEYATPQAIPADYYDEISMHWTGPVIFTEIAWPASANAPFPGDATGQDDFVDLFFGLTESLPIEYANWLFLHDFDGQAGTPGFIDVGLRNNDGSVVRPADVSWQAAVGLRERP